jgi:hypothetical protein
MKLTLGCWNESLNGLDNNRKVSNSYYLIDKVLIRRVKPCLGNLLVIVAPIQVSTF